MSRVTRVSVSASSGGSIPVEGSSLEAHDGAEGGEEEAFFVSGGILEVQPHVVTVLSDTALRAEDVDEAAALAAKEQAEQTLADRQTDIDFAAARAELAEAMAQLQAIQRLRRRTGRS